METCTYEGSEQECRSLVYGKHTSKARNHAVNNSIDIFTPAETPGEIVFILFINLFFFPAPLWIHPEHIIHILITPALRSFFFYFSFLENCARGKKRPLELEHVLFIFIKKHMLEASQIAGRRFAAGFRRAAGKTCGREPVDEMTGRRVAICLVFTCFPARHAGFGGRKKCCSTCFLFGL